MAVAGGEDERLRFVLVLVVVTVVVVVACLSAEEVEESEVWVVERLVLAAEGF